MQFADVLCYVFLTITVTASCSRAEEQSKEVEDTEDGKRITKREATLIVDFNNNHMDKIFQKPKVIYRRISKSRYGPPKAKYGSPKPKYGPPRPKHRPSKGTRKPGKKSRTGKPRTSSPKYGPPETFKTHHPYTNKKRASKNKPKYGVPKQRPNLRPSFGHVVKMPHYSYFVPEKTSFGEPPAHLVEHQSHKQSYGEPPVDSYGAPLKPSINDVYPSPHSFQESSPHEDLHDYTKPDYQWNHNYAGSDNSYAFTKEPKFTNFVTPNPKDSELDSMDPVVGSKHTMQDNIKFFFRKKRPFYFGDSKVVNKPWKANKHDEFDDEIIVGGQYAEPPARFMPKVRQHSPMYEDDEDEETLPALQGYVDVETAQSAHNSPYSNYKNSNMAFSPQNLNDAFSIVDK
ncbi:hypothetical protein PYW07_008861 [Mythimna separata]|uniref:Uncharacterized protein n=1 Tax=Mythimna separata TaxID=271217 RepID=A0AAD7YB34_MYTSE|nr:hypothetical protein PYW07_008861 [Mythimna separata]